MSKIKNNKMDDRASEEVLSKSSDSVIYYNFSKVEAGGKLSEYIGQLKSDLLWLREKMSQEISKTEDR